MSVIGVFLPHRSIRWNFTVMGLDLSLFVFALSFSSAYGVLPLFVSHLAGSNLALGAIPALRSTSLLPPLLVARYTERLPHKKPFVIVCTVIERLPYLVLALVTPLLALSHPIVLLWCFFALLAFSTMAGGVSMPAWLDLIARMVPADWRGRSFGLASASGGLLGVAGSAGAALILRRFSWSLGCALCFGCTFVGLVLSFIFIALGREPASEPSAMKSPAHVTTESAPERFVPLLRTLLRNDRNLRWYLVALVLITCGSAAAGFYIVDAKRSLGLTDAQASLYAVILLAATTGGNVLWGYVGDRLGHKRIVVMAALCMGLAPLVAILTRGSAIGVVGYGLVFLLVGLGTSAFQLASFTFIIDFAPVTLRPTFIGMATMAQAPFAFGAPIICALIADRTGYPFVFALTALLAGSATLLVARCVRDPRTDAAVPLMTDRV